MDSRREIENLTAAELREIAEVGEEQMQPILARVATADAGEFTCPACQACATWQRRRRDWNAGCTQCQWSAAGKLPASAISS